MVFSFFKKQPEKMVARPAVRPSGSGSEDTLPPVSVPAKDEKADEASLTELTEFSDFGFSQSSFDIQVEGDIDPVNASAEEAAVLFANNQDQAAQTILENMLKQQRSGSAERLWLMLFDLYRFSNQASAFEAMSIEYAHEFEKSPPVWKTEAEPKRPAKAKSGSLFFKGDLLGGNTAAFDAVRQALTKERVLRLDMSRVGQADPEGSACFLELLSYIRKNRFGFELRGKDRLIERVKDSVEAGRREMPVTGKASWLLLLELFQQRGQQELFEELAIDYAVTFEESPPSWDTRRVEAPEAAIQEKPAVKNDTRNDDAYILTGEVKASRFADMQAFAQKRETLLIDCAKLTRIDFVSAGALLNVLSTVRGMGKQIIFRYPNHLVAELFRVVGLDAVAMIIFAKH